MSFELIFGDITTINVDAIVNAANSSLLGGGGVDGAIHKKAGRALLDECVAIRNKQGGCKTGDAVITCGGNLPVKYVIHTVGPVWNGNKEEKAMLLKRCYENSLTIALEYGFKSIAFPNISTGIYKFPKQLACEIAINAVTDFEFRNNFEKIIFVCFDEENFNIYNNRLSNLEKNEQ